MNDKRQIRSEIITSLCGDENLSEDFINLLKAGGLTENDGKIIRNEMLDEIDSNNNLDIMFKEFYRKRLDDVDDYPVEEMNLYTQREEYLDLVKSHFPQSLNEACDIIINMLDEDDLRQIREMEKSTFRRWHHFGIGLFVRNHFGINQRLAGALLVELYEKTDSLVLMSDELSDIFLDELWEEIQRRN